MHLYFLQNRIIVVREPDGTLRKAKWDERNRSNHIYFTRPGHYMRVPKMFQPEFLKVYLLLKCLFCCKKSI